jgi:hypothetical protein
MHFEPPRDLEKVESTHKKVNDYFNKKISALVNWSIDVTNKMQQISIEKYNLISY